MKNYFELSKKELQEIKEKALDRSFGLTPFAYYINNVVSLFGDHPQRIGSAVCDIVYWTESKIKKKLDLDVVGWYVNELCYNQKYNMGGKTYSSILEDLVKYLVIVSKQEEYSKGVKDRYLEK